MRSDTRTDGGAGVSRLGVTGPAVDRLVNLLLVSYEYIVTGMSHKQAKFEASHYFVPAGAAKCVLVGRQHST